MVDAPYTERNRLDVLYTLVVEDLDTCRRFYESLGLVVAQQHEIAWVYPPPNVGDPRFLFQLRRGESKDVVIGIRRSKTRQETLKALGLEPVDQSGVNWRGYDPNGRSLEVSIKK